MCVGRSRLRIGHESFRFVRNGLESFLFRHQTYIRGRHGTQHAKEVEGREGRRTGEVPGGGRKVSGTVVGVCLVPVGWDEVHITTVNEFVYRREVVLPLRISTEASPTCRSCLLYTSPSPRDGLLSRMPSSA